MLACWACRFPDVFDFAFAAEMCRDTLAYGVHVDFLHNWAFCIRDPGDLYRRRRPQIGKSFSVSFRFRVVPSSERARGSCVGVRERSVCQRSASEW